MLDTAGAVQRVYRLAGTPEDRKAFLRTVFARLIVTDKNITHIEYQAPFHLLLGHPPFAGSGASWNATTLDYFTGLA